MDERKRKLLAQEASCFRELDSIVRKSDGPALMRRFVGRKPSKTLSAEGWGVWHQAVAYALAGQKRPLEILLRSHAYFVSANYPIRTAYMEESAQILRWCAGRVGLLGWAEVWDVPVTIHQAASSMDRPLVYQGDGRYAFPETDAVFRRDYGDLSGKSGWRSVPNGEVSGLQQLVMALERTLLSLSVPALSSACGIRR